MLVYDFESRHDMFKGWNGSRVKEQEGGNYKILQPGIYELSQILFRNFCYAMLR